MKKLLTIVFTLSCVIGYSQAFDFYTRGSFYKNMRVYDSTAVANSIAGKAPNIANFYLKDSSFSSDRTVNMNGKILAFQQGGSDLFNIDPAHGVVITSADGSSTVSAQSTFGLKHAGIGSGSESISLNGTDNTTVISSNSLHINNAYTIPVVDGTPNQVLTTNGLGTASWQSVTTGTVTSVSGTTNRITSTGGATPVIDISSTFEGLLLKKTDSSTSSVSNYVTQYQRKKTSDSLQANIDVNTTVIAGKQAALSGTGLVSFSGTTPSYNTTSANIAGIISDESGTDKIVFNTTPTLVTPILGVATATSINKVAITAPATSATLAIADGKTLTVSRTLTLTGTDATTMTFPTTSATIARTEASQTFSGTQTFANIVDPVLSGGTGAASTLTLKSTNGSGSSDAIIFGVAANGSIEAMRILTSGRIGIGVVAPTAMLHLKAGTATVNTEPLKFTSGTNLTTAETGAMEYDGTNLFFTRTGTTRETVITSNAVNSVSPTAPNRTITVVIAGTTYYLSAKTTND